MKPRRVLVGVLLLAVGLAGGRTTAGTPTIASLLDSYAAGTFDPVLATLDDDLDLDRFLDAFRRDAPAWIGAAGPDRRAGRELVAATVALEAARAGQWREWKLVQKQPPMCGPDGCYQPLNVLVWKAPPLLIEWGCELFRKDAAPRSVERWWQLAALAVAQRSEDPQFLVGDPAIGRGAEAGEIGNVDREIKHLDHVKDRFPKERRFLLAQGIARDRVWAEDALQVYTAIQDDPDVGGEAVMRLGAMRVRHGRVEEGLDDLERTEDLTRDPYVLFLARYFSAQVYHRQRRPDDAEAAYRGAVAAVPHAQSATLALAAIVFRDGRRAEAHRLVRDMLNASPAPSDPWRAFVHADDRFWPQLIARLRAEIRR